MSSNVYVFLLDLDVSEDCEQSEQIEVSEVSRLK